MRNLPLYLPVALCGLLFAKTSVAETEPIGIEVKEGIRVVYHVTLGDRGDDGVGKAVAGLKHLVQLYNQNGVPMDQRKIVAVFDVDAAPFVISDAASARIGAGATNPNAPLIAELIKNGVSVEICGQRMKHDKLTQEDLLPGVLMDVSGQMRVIDLELRDYAYFQF